jgi:probable rRNA maturation factor
MSRKVDGVRLRRGKLIPREDGKRIEEFVGAATTGMDSMSVAKMLAPPGWSAPARQAEFDEVMLVLTGELTLVLDGKRERVGAGEVGLVPRGRRIVVRNDGQGACDYWSICAPAFSPERAHQEEAAEAKPADNTVTVQMAHGQAEDFARLLSARGRDYLKRLGLTGCELSLSLVGDRAIRRLNRTWRQKDKAGRAELPRGRPAQGHPGAEAPGGRGHLAGHGEAAGEGVRPHAGVRDGALPGARPAAPAGARP